MGKEVTKPIILREGAYRASDLEELRSYSIWKTIDVVESQLADLFEVTHPHLAGDPNFTAEQTKFIANRTGLDKDLVGDWIYLPWSGYLLHTLTETEQFALRTNRNRSLITEDEQNKLAKAHIAIAGLSVGGGIAVSLSYAGIGSTLYLADFDRLETPNLNRVQASLADLGKPKAQVTAERIWAVNPYAHLTLFPKGIDQTTVHGFLGGDKPAAVGFDEIDDFEMKVRLRYEAKKLRIPVVMLTGLGDSILIDIERYDLEPDLQIFNGLIGDLESKLLAGDLTSADKQRFAAQIIGLANVPTRAIESLLEIGSTLVGRPQLGSTVTIESGVAAFVVRQILLGSPLASGRYRLDLNALLNLPLETAASAKRDAAIQQLLKPRSE